ncbi:MAG: hypothetical protein ACRCX4_02255 [Bacteroidales bacterium]
MKHSFQFILLSLFFSANYSTAYAQEDKKEFPLNTEKKPLIMNNSGLDSLRMPVHLQPFIDRLDLIDKSSLLNIKESDNELFRLPSDTSYYMRRITLLRMFHNPQSEKYGKEHTKMYKNNIPDKFRDYLKDTRPAVLFSGCLDPVEAIRNYKKEMRARKVREILGKLKEIKEKDSCHIIPLPGTLQTASEHSSDSVTNEFTGTFEKN